MTQANPALEAFLKSIPLFSLVEPPEMMDILRLLRPVELQPSEVLFKQGEVGNAMWVLGQGVEVSISAQKAGAARPVVLATAKGGETVGEMALVDDGQRSATAVVVKAGPAHKIEAQDFHALRQGLNPGAFKIMRRICMDLCAKLRATSARIAPSTGVGGAKGPKLPPGRAAAMPDIEEFVPFQSFPMVARLALAQKLTVMETQGIEPIFAEGDVADAAYFVIRGEVTVGRRGKTFTTTGPGGMFGLVAAIDGGKRSASCLTAGPAKLLRLADADFDSLFATGNKIAFRIVDLVARQLVAHLREANAHLLGGQEGASSIGAALSAISPISEEDLLVDGEILPLDLELSLPEGDEPMGDIVLRDDEPLG